METWFTDNQTYLGVPGLAAVNATFTGTGSIGGDTVSLSDGNKVKLLGAGASGFCLKVDSSRSSGTPYVYDSQYGGLQPGSTNSCVAATF